MFKYRQLVRFPSTVGKCDTSESPIFAYLLRSHGTFILDKPTRGVFGQSVPLGMSNRQVPERWERHRNDQADICQK